MLESDSGYRYEDRARVCVCVQEDVIGRLQSIVPFTLDSDGIADNLCKVEVFYEQFDYESIEESEAYPVIRPLTRVISSVVFDHVTLCRV